MRFKGIVLGLSTCMLGSSAAFAGAMGPATSPFHAVIAVLGGYANINGGDTQTYYDNLEGAFIYTNPDNGNSNGFIGGFLGIEHELSYPGFILQGGVEYDTFGTTTINGINYVGADQPTYTVYNYNYQFHTQQVYGIMKLLGTTHEVYHPYAAVGLGAAFNDAKNFAVTTQEIDPLNIAPVFNNNSTTSFSYNLNLGIEADLFPHVRLGLGYRFSSFGTSSLGDGLISFNDYSCNPAFTVKTPNAYANQLLAQISYVA